MDLLSQELLQLDLLSQNQKSESLRVDTLGLKTEEEDVWLAVQMDSRPCDKEMETSSYNLSLSNSVLFPTGLPDMSSAVLDATFVIP